MPNERNRKIFDNIFQKSYIDFYLCDECKYIYFGEKYCRDYEQAFNFVKSELPKFFTRAGLNKDNIIWYAGLHENTDNKHIHISFFEKEPEYYKNGGKLSYHNGTISKQVLIDNKP